MSGDLLRKLAAIGLSVDQAAAVMDIMAEEAEERKSKVRARVQKWRDKQSVTSRNVTKHAETLHEGSCAGDARVEDNLLTKNQSGQEEKKERDARDARSFDSFWALYPNKVGKREAEKAFSKALSRASFDAIMDGLGRYVAKIDDRPWCNPATFLNQNRWEDMPAVLGMPMRTGPPQAGVSGAARRIMESERNGSGSIFGNHGDAQLISAAGSGRSRDAPANIQSGIGRQFRTIDH